MSNSQIKYPTKVIRSESSPEWKDLAACLSGSLEEYSYTGGDWANVVLNNAYSEELEFSRHSFSIPASATITGIEFTYLVWAKSPFVAGSDVSPPATDIKDTTIRLMKNGVPIGDNKASAVGWPAYLNNYYLYDNFCNGVDGSSITSYTPNFGSSWNVSGSSNFSVRTLGSLDGTTTQETSLVFGGSCVANKNSDENFRGVQLDTNLAATTAWADSGSSDGTGGMIFYPYGTNAQSYWDFIFRRTDASNFYFVRVVNLTRRVLLYKVQGGLETNLASYTWSSGNKEVGWKDGCGVGLLWKTSVVWTGSSVSIIVNNSFDGYLGFTLNHTLADSFNQTATQCGFRTNSADSVIKKFFVHGSQRSFETRTVGSSSDLWGTTWSPSQINQTSFGSVVQFENLTGSDQTAALNIAYLRVYYDEVFNEIGRGGSVIGGSAGIEFYDNYDGTSGVVVGGVAEESANLGFTLGGIVVSGTADAPFVGPSNGGVFVGGTATFIYDEIASGGVVTSGVAYEQWYIPSQGGVVVAGNPDIQSYIVPLGGIVVGGQHEQTFIDYVDGTGGVIAGGNAIRADLRIIHYESQSESSPIIIGGEASGGITGVNLTSYGGVEINGAANASFSFNLDLEILWNTRASIESDLTFLWNLGQLPIYWYRIIGKGRDGGECNLVADPCCQKFIVNIHARTLSELCDKLRDRKLNLPIESIQRFSRPAETGVEGYDDECNVLEPVGFCQIPKCAEFCVDYEQGVNQNIWGFKMTAQVDSFFDYEITDGVFVGGSAVAVLKRFVPDFPYVATGGINIDGTSDVISSGYYYEAQGGVEISGEAERSLSDWSYVGGEWPSIIQKQYSSDQESLPNDPSDKPWSLIERISDEDGLYASTDISYIKTSDFLIARNFNLDIPSGSSVLGLKVSIERFATQSGVRDVEVYLVVGDEIISNNLADTTNDWPVGVSFSPKKYGQNGYDGSGEPWSDEPLQVVDLTDPSFGVAIRVESLISLPATIANIDYIAIKAFYEDAPHQRLQLGGMASVVSSAMSYVGDGEIFIGGEAEAFATNAFKYVGSGGMLSGGKQSETMNVDVGGGIISGGESVVDPIWGEGGSIIGGAAKVTPYFETGEGGVLSNGKSLDYFGKRYEATGGITMGGTAGSPAGIFVYEATGGITMGGVADRSSSAWYWESSGNAIFVLGSAGQSASDFGTLNQTAEFSMAITDMIMAFASDQHLGDAVGVNENIRQCGCLTVPLIINFEHNFVRDNILAQFLRRNNFTLSNRLKLYFSRTNTSWQTNLHYKGLSADANTQEVWDIVVELQCTSVVGAIEIGRNIWKLSVQLFRKNLTNGDDYDTRIILGVLPESICGTNANELNFKVTYDTQSEAASVVPTSTIYQSSIFDNIGLFKKPSWIENPDLIFTVSQTGLNVPQFQLNLTDQVLNVDNRPVGYFSNGRNEGYYIVDYDVDGTPIVLSEGPTPPTQVQNQN